MPDRVLPAALINTILTTAAFAYWSFPPSHAVVTDKPGTADIVPADQIVSGGPLADGIPSIDNPKFVAAVNASSFLSDDFDWVVGVCNGDVRAYPLQVMVWHEIVNDVVGGVRLAVTSCHSAIPSLALSG